MMPAHDVVILGGGLAGLTLALQLKQRFADIDVLVLERKAHPVPEAAHKVGESTVEIGANYFDTVLGLKDHMMTAQLKKFGFRFFFSEGRRDVDRVTELGASTFLSTGAWQIDRGIFENFLGETVRARGIGFIDGATVKNVALSESGGLHEVEYEHDLIRYTVSAKWVVDASGRAGFLKRRLGLAQDNAHDANAVWFRIDTKIDVDDWSQDREWLTRCNPPNRWLSTSHLCGEGYWVWLIPLASGSHSVGIVCDAKLHPLQTMNTFDLAMEWFRVHQPRLFDALDDKRHLLQDFLFLRNFSYGCKQVFSGRRWALTGEAGLFLDPFYSPGSDFIAIANTYITELIAKDRAGEPFDAYAPIYEQLYYSFYESTLAMYTDQYRIFGDAEVMPVKVVWDYTYYWGVLGPLFFQRRLTDLAALGRLRDELANAKALNVAVQKLLREWSAVSAKRNPPQLLDQASWPWFAELNRVLRDPLDDDAAFKARMRRNCATLRTLAREIVERACAEHPGLDADAIRALIGDDVAPGGLLFERAA
ncbi:MAG TPA: tryptophan 7-halogenase [Xanthomonadales bacterium]|nr:tryptophan 7-halogenase [Xanthomonadales bacterium]